MKLVFGVLALMLSLSSLASNGESRTIVYDGSQNQFELFLRGERTHTEYRLETRWSTCTRTETHYRRVCRRQPNGQTVCRQVPHTRTVHYSCRITVNVPYEVKDYDVESRVLVDVTSDMNLPVGERLEVKLHGDQLSLRTSSKTTIFLLQKQDVRMSGSGSIRYLDAHYVVHGILAKPVMDTLKMNHISLANNVVNFDFGPLSNHSIGFHLQVKKAPLLGSDTTLFDRELNNEELTINASQQGTQAQVDLDQLGVRIGGGRHTITARAYLKYTGVVLNAAQFDGLEATRTLIYKN